MQYQEAAGSGVAAGIGLRGADEERYTDGGVTGAVVAGEAASRLEALFGSAKWKLASAQIKTKLADALASGDQDRIAAAIGRITATVNATSPRGSQTGLVPASEPRP
jgi:hypothetical protein